MRHATDADHVVAIATIVARHRSLREAALVGAVWGLGHTLTILMVGGAIILLGWIVPVRLGLSLEFSVALMLIVLGVANLRAFFRWQDRVTLDLSGRSPGVLLPQENPSANESSALTQWFDVHWGRLRVYQLLRPFWVGLVHGLAGSAAVALLVLTIIQDPLWAVGYLLVFGVGTIAGMMLITTAIGWPLLYTGQRAPRLGQQLRMASGAVSLLFGLFLAYQIGIVHGLFTAHPLWNPR